MSKYTITSEADNDILRSIECRPEWASIQVQAGETLHNGNYCADEFIFDGVSFISREDIQPRLLIQKSGKELAIDIIKQLRGAGNDLPMHDDTMTTKIKAKRLIDQAAGRVRSRFASPGNMIAEEYNQAKRQSIWFLANISEPVPPMIQSWATASSRTPTEAAQNIVNTGLEWEQVLNVTYHLRLIGKAAVDSSTIEEFKEIANSYINQLDQIK
jgi:hypothetical protein